MNTESEQPAHPVGDLFGVRELLQLVAQKLSSQALLFALAIVVIVVVTGLLFKDQANQGLPIIAAVLAVFLVSVFGYLFVEQKQKVQQEDPATMSQLLGGKMANIENTTEDFNIKLWTTPKNGDSAASRDIVVVPEENSAAEYQVGDKIVVRFQANKDCYLTLLNLGTSGKLTVLYPNSIYKDNRIQAGTLYEIPGDEYGFEFELQGPPGIERLKAVATLEPVKLLEDNFAPDGSLFLTERPSAAARDIAVIKKKVEDLPAQKWAEATHEFFVG